MSWPDFPLPFLFLPFRPTLFFSPTRTLERGSSKTRRQRVRRFDVSARPKKRRADLRALDLCTETTDALLDGPERNTRSDLGVERTTDEETDEGMMEDVEMRGGTMIDETGELSSLTGGRKE